MIGVTISVLIKLFNTTSSDQHKLACLLPLKHKGNYSTRNERVYGFPRFRRNRRLYQLCVVVQTCYYNVSLCVNQLKCATSQITLFFFSFQFFIVIVPY